MSKWLKPYSIQLSPVENQVHVNNIPFLKGFNVDLLSKETNARNYKNDHLYIMKSKSKRNTTTKPKIQPIINKHSIIIRPTNKIKITVNLININNQTYNQQ